MARKIKTLNTRAIEYRDTRKLPDPYCYEVQDAWLAGYRAALRDFKEFSAPASGGTKL